MAEAAASDSSTPGAGALRFGSSHTLRDAAVEARDLRLAARHHAVVVLGVERDLVLGDREHASAQAQRPGELTDRGREPARALHQRGHDEVAESVAGQPVVALEAVLEQPAPHLVAGRQRDDAVAQVADRGDVEGLAEKAGRSAVVGHRHHRGDVGRAQASVVAGAGELTLQSQEQDREPGAAPDTDDL